MDEGWETDVAYQQVPGHAQYQPQVPMRNGPGTAALVLGIIGVVLAMIPIIGFIGFICGLIGVILGGIGWTRVSNRQASNKGASIAGVVLSVLAVIVSTTVFVATVAGVDAAVNGGVVAPADGSAPSIPAPGAASAPTVFDAGQAADSDGLVITVSPLEKTQEKYLGTRVCTSVTYRNGSNDEFTFASYDWELKNPANVIVHSTYVADGALDFGSLAPGGNVAGRVCFDDLGAAGQYEILYRSTFFSGRQIAWRASL